VITNAVQRGTTIYVYNERGQQILALSGDPNSLKGYTSGSVNVLRGSSLYTYNEQGQVINVMSA
jgi:hypothetical protein